MQQYLSLKEKYANEILFFRMGDFYEMFLEDAIYAANVLDITLTKRGDGVPMCGIPYHAWQNYVLKILNSGKNVAICEQMENTKDVKNRIVKRDVIRILTPGTIFEEELIGDANRSLLASLLFPYPTVINTNSSKDLSHKTKLSLAITDLSTGELWLDLVSEEEIEDYLAMRGVRELLISSDKEFSSRLDLQITIRNYHFTQNQCEKKLKTYFKLAQVALLEFSETEILNLYRLFSYTEEIAPRLKIQWQNPTKYYLQKDMYLDGIALQTLEILNDQEGGEKSALISILDQTKTKAGKRLLRELLVSPSLNKQDICERHSLVDFFVQEKVLREKVQELLKQVKDIARILNHLRYAPKVIHLGDIKKTLEALKALKYFIGDSQKKLPPGIADFWDNTKFPSDILERLQNTLVENELPPLLDERRFVKEGFSEELDELFTLSGSTHKLISNFEKAEQKKWGISTLKIRYNRVIGYYIEISKGVAHLAPKHYLRRQTLTNAERFTLDELNEFESRVLNAKEHIIEKQKKIFDELNESLLAETSCILQWNHQASLIDCIVSFAEVAIKNKYIRPSMRNDDKLILKNSRHPVVEEIFKEEVFVANDIYIDPDGDHLAILTGPNMSGKSTYIRQIGLIQIMAQAGSFVPASHAELPLVDRIFTRIGAYDRLSKGESTFFVEMSECAKIFQHYTRRSLLLLDEVGRGTSTFDGVSIAQAMLEFFNQKTNPRAKILFATHFTELSELINPNQGIFGLTIQVIEKNGHITFLRKIKKGVTSKSYGIHVAKLAGVPDEIISRAQNIMQKFEELSMKPLHNADEKDNALEKDLSKFSKVSQKETTFTTSSSMKKKQQEEFIKKQPAMF